ncbi:NAD(P)H-dependent oxidoreductase [Sphingomonas aerophila]|uniref:NAD(P)H dehydrogenase (Quinone) n=1 Tax=Sphingomonas aerophila TaxID=1344948 RepID=A0A7W9BF77_9SPHN|nr:NAD(P)H dehydrogenase (quinone) [Sphingomonas aerophila]
MSIDQAAPRHVVILCHPEERSFNASVAERYCASVQAAGHQAVLRDLYRMGFDPVLHSAERPGPNSVRCKDVEDELDVIRGADVFVLVYPIWFGSAPAMLKGYVERVLGSGVEPSAIQARTAQGVLTGKRLVSFTSSAASDVWLALHGQPRSLESIFDTYITHAFQMQASRHFHFGLITPETSEFAVQCHLSDVDMRARTLVREMKDADHNVLTPKRT